MVIVGVVAGGLTQAQRYVATWNTLGKAPAQGPALACRMWLSSESVSWKWVRKADYCTSTPGISSPNLSSRMGNWAWKLRNTEAQKSTREVATRSCVSMAQLWLCPRIMHCNSRALELQSMTPSCLTAFFSCQILIYPPWYMLALSLVRASAVENRMTGFFWPRLFGRAKRVFGRASLS